MEAKGKACRYKVDVAILSEDCFFRCLHNGPGCLACPALLFHRPSHILVSIYAYLRVDNLTRLRDLARDELSVVEGMTPSAL